MTDDDLHDALLAIDGVGEATAEKIEAVYAEHGQADVTADLDAALDYLDAGEAGYAAKFVRRALGDQ